MNLLYIMSSSCGCLALLLVPQMQSAALLELAAHREGIDEQCTIFALNRNLDRRKDTASKSNIISMWNTVISCV